MAHPRTQPMELPDWAPLSPPTRYRGRAGQVGRWLWPSTALAAFAALTAFVFATDPAAGPAVSIRGLVALALAVLVLAVLTVRRRWGLRVVFRTLAEYAAVAVLAGLLVAAVPPVERPARADRRPAAEQTSTLPPVIRQVVGAAGWLAEQWREADRRTSPPSTTRPKPKEGRP